MQVAIVKYNAGNVRSVLFALKRLGVEGILTDDSEKLRSADKVIFPGVGEASSAMRHLKERNLDQLIPSLKQPVLGICLGMQLMAKHSEEGNTDCLGILDAKVKRFSGTRKIPLIGWNSTTFGDEPSAYYYYVHSFYMELNEFAVARAAYGFEYSAAIRKDNFFAVQFHPERSGIAGEQVLKQFLEL